MISLEDNGMYAHGTSITDAYALAWHLDATDEWRTRTLDIYFCDPHSPWQRGTNENFNGLLRQYFRKGTDLGVYSSDDLDWVAQELNDRPRKRLAFKKPIELIGDLLLR